MKEDAVYLHHIQECIRRIEEDTVGPRSLHGFSHLSGRCTEESPDPI